MFWNYTEAYCAWKMTLHRRNNRLVTHCHCSNSVSTSIQLASCWLNGLSIRSYFIFKNPQSPCLKAGISGASGDMMPCSRAFQLSCFFPGWMHIPRFKKLRLSEEKIPISNDTGSGFGTPLFFFKEKKSLQAVSKLQGTKIQSDLANWVNVCLKQSMTYCVKLIKLQIFI